ncbi:hypothetical protein EPN15_01425 [Patescibacteria group bacterium]|nr:MAG: hypothetical protein EPN15_01425 [Patescibacteria group bacterium]
MSENLKSKFIPILLILIVIAIAGWYVGAKTLSLKNQNSASLNQNTNSSEQKWESYVNEKYKYQFEYPAWYAILNSDSTNENATFSGNDQYWYFISSISDSKFSSLNEWLTENKDKTMIEKRKIDGYDAMIVKYANEEGYSAMDRVIALIKDDKLFTLQSRINLSDLAKILDSFKFEN